MPGYEIVKAGGRIGAVVTGVDLGTPRPAAVFADVERDDPQVLPVDGVIEEGGR